MRVFLYARVSTKDKGQEVENQLAELRKFAMAQGWTIIHVYIDHETGSEADRAEFKAMMLACSQRKADIVLFWALDRLTREGVLPTLQYLNTLTSYGVGFKSFTEQYLDSCGIFKEAVISILATIAKQERQRIRERVIAGMARARENGARFGRPKVSADLAEIRQMREHRESYRRIAAKLGVSEGTVRNLVKSSARPRKKGVENRP
jgi:DNA invertase Pin-like site-specific DNA recombinase